MAETRIRHLPHIILSATTTPTCSVRIKQFERIWYRENQLFSCLVRKVWWQWLSTVMPKEQVVYMYFRGRILLVSRQNENPLAVLRQYTLCFYFKAGKEPAFEMSYMPSYSDNGKRLQKLLLFEYSLKSTVFVLCSIWNIFPDKFRRA